MRRRAVLARGAGVVCAGLLLQGCAAAPERTRVHTPAEAWGSGLRAGTPSARPPAPPGRPSLPRPAPSPALDPHALEPLPPRELRGFPTHPVLPRRSHGSAPAPLRAATPSRPPRHEPRRAQRAGQARVERVVDGDTVWLTGLTGDALPASSVRVRILHVNSPELPSASRPGECYAQEARKELERLLPQGGVVTATSEGALQDQYGRYLLHLSAGGGDVGTALVSAGAASAEVPPGARHEERLRAAQQRAQQQRLGLWGC